MGILMELLVKIMHDVGAPCQCTLHDVGAGCTLDRFISVCETTTETAVCVSFAKEQILLETIFNLIKVFFLCV